MRCIFIFLCSISYISFAEGDIPEIRIDLIRDPRSRTSGGKLECKVTQPELAVSAPYHIYLDTTEIIYRSKCRRYHDGTELNAIDNVPIKQSNRPGYVYKNNTMHLVGRNNFYCKFYTKMCLQANKDRCYYKQGWSEHEDEGIRCNFTVNVVRPEDLRPVLTGYLTANERNITTFGTDVYHFYDGQPTDFVCIKTSGALVQLVYQREDSSPISTGFQPTGSVYLYMKLTAANANTFLECTIADAILQHKEVFSVQLSIYTRSTEVLSFEVNGLILPSIKKEEPTGVIYTNEYYYYHGESLSLKLLRDKQRYGAANCDAAGNNGAPEVLNKNFNVNHEPFPDTFYRTHLYEGQSPVTLTCTVASLTDNTQEHVVKIRFIFERPNIIPLVSELSMANIMVMYETANANIIEYAQSNEALRLICGTGASPAKWINSGKEFDHYINSTIPNVMEVKPGATKARLKCESKNPSTQPKVTYVELLRPKQSEAAPITPSAHPKDIGSGAGTPGSTVVQNQEPVKQNTSVNTYPPPGTKESHETNTVSDSMNIAGPAAGCAVAVIVLIAVVLAVLNLRMKRQRTRHTNLSSIDYQNLPQHREGPMATPAQWDEPTEPTYAEVHKNTEPTYAEVHKNTEPTYAEVHKSAEPTYAEVHKSTEPTYAEVHKSTEPTYAEVHKSAEPTYAEVHKSKEPTYAEVHKSAEPTYAEVHKSTKPTYAEVEKSGNQNRGQNHEQLTYVELEPTSSRSQVRLSSNTATYAQILHKKPQEYANPKDLKPHYVNVSDKTEYAEPAYCEVGALK